MALTVSVMTGGVNNHPTTSEEANGLATDFVSAGIIGAYTNTSGVAPSTGGFAVNAQGTPDMTVAVSAGVAYVTGTPSSQNSQMFRVKNTASTNVTISANSSGSTKYDWLYIKLDATLLNAPTLVGDTTVTLVTSRSTSNTTDDGTPPTYGYLLAVITVANGAASITNSVIRDRRVSANIGTSATNNTGWLSSLLPAVSSVTENGNSSADITFASTVASILTPGMRLRTSRTVAAPTQCTSLNGTTQYYSKASPNKLTFTDDFTTMARVKLSSYAAGGIISRFSTSGWILRTNASGQVEIYADNGVASRAFLSCQSLPLNKWVHVAASLDMSGASGLIYFDGTLVPSASSGGTGTILTQAGSLNIGATNGAAFFPGKIAQAAVFDAVLSASTIRSYKNQGLSGSETNLKSAYSFNNSITDLNTTTPNDLTANGSAVATNADSPFTQDANGTPGGTYDYAIVTKVSTTVATVQYPEGCAIPTSGGISTVDIATTKAPFGMPVDEGRWEVLTLVASRATTAAGIAVNTVTNPGGIGITVPSGAFKLSYAMGVIDLPSAGVAYLLVAGGLSTSASSISNYELMSQGPAASPASAQNNAYLYKERPVSLSSATFYYFVVKPITPAVTHQLFTGYDSGLTNDIGIIRAIPAYL